MRNFTDKVAVITGAGSGIGQALALSLAQRGAHLALSDINFADVVETAARCEKEGVKAQAYELDVASKDAVFAHADEVVSTFGTVNLVVNNAGVALVAPVLAMSYEDLEWVMNVDFWGVVHGTKAFLPHLIESGRGHLVNVSSVFGLVGVPTQSAYNAAKFAVRGFTESIRQEMLIEKRPVGVSCVHPGGIKTNIVRNARINDGWDDDRKQRERFDQTVFTSPKGAARTIVRGIQLNQSRILIGPDAYVIDAIPRLLGPSYQRLMAAGTRIAGRFGLDLGGYSR